MITPTLFGLATAVGALYANQRSILYRRPRFRRHAPAALPEPFVRVRYPTADGLQLVAWHAPAEPGRRRIIYFPGCRGEPLWHARRLLALAAAGDGVLIAGYRGYAGNPGRPSERGLLADAAAAARFMAEAAGDAAGTGLVAWGYSLGTALATAVAAGETAAEPGPKPGPMIARLVLEAPFESVLAVVRSRLPMAPASLIRDRFDIATRIGRVGCPVLIVHGARDPVVPWRQAWALSRAAPIGAAFLLLPGAAHADLEAHGSIAAIRRFLDPPT